MPMNQVANIGVFDFGAPVASTTVLKWRADENTGGKISLKFENTDGAADGTVSVQVSPDNSSWNATTAGNNLAAVTSQSVPKRTSKEFTILLRRDTDLYMRINASGGCRMQVQIQSDVHLEPMVI